jgi:hypothetical protein
MEAEAKKITLEFTVEETNTIIAALMDFSAQWKVVNPLLVKIQEQ